VIGVEFFTPFTFEFKTHLSTRERRIRVMAKKIANPEKLKAEIALQTSKIETLRLLDAELSRKVERLNLQRKQVHEKIQKLNHAYQQNVLRYKSIQGK